MEPKLIREKVKPDELVRLIRDGLYDTMAKLAVDVERGILAIGGEWHSDAEEVLTADGSQANNVWGVNFYPWKESRERIVYTSLINLKPLVPHRKMEITDLGMRTKIHDLVTRLLLYDDETLPAE
ncbi:MAG: DUF5674 family protein [bacterium]|nr:DUF5674 family protein [bacterium]MDZ4285111.1 DUF5674 family protein [Patescibacteria group bacterium]